MGTAQLAIQRTALQDAKPALELGVDGLMVEAHNPKLTDAKRPVFTAIGLYDPKFPTISA